MVEDIKEKFPHGNFLFTTCGICGSNLYRRQD